MAAIDKEEIRVSLKGGGEWLGAARNWLLWHKDPHGRLTWGSADEVRMTVKEIEELALEVATAAIHAGVPTRRAMPQGEKIALPGTGLDVGTGTHRYRGAEAMLKSGKMEDFFTSDCENGCGCWMGGSRSGGPDGIDPFGACPKAKKV